MKNEVQRLLRQVKAGEVDIDLAQRLLYVWFDKAKSAHCILDRLPDECCIYLNTGKRDCKEACGHYR